MTKFLKTYQIYFTTLAAISLSIMSVVLTCNSNRIAQRQSDISYTENMPDFELSSDYIMDTKTQKAVELQIKLACNNGKFNNLSINHKTFVKLSVIDTNYASREYLFLLTDYLDWSQSLSNRNGEIKLFGGENNNIRFYELEDYINLKLSPYKLQTVKFDSFSVFELTYINFLNENITEYYTIHGKYGSILNDKSDEVMYFKNHKSLYTEKKVFDLLPLSSKENDFSIKLILNEWGY